VKYADADGRQIQETIGREVDGVTRKHAERELGDRLVRVERKGYRRLTAMTFQAWSATWHEEGQRRRNWKPKTVDRYRKVLEYLDGYFGPMRLDAIRPRDVSAFTREKLETFSAKYVNLMLNVLHDVMKTAVVEEIITTNPVVGVERPKVIRQRWRILEPHEVPRVSKAFTDSRARRVFLTLVLTGVRRMELIGLRWRHVNLVEGTLRVAESKSEEGERLIALPATLLEELMQHYAISAYKHDDDYVFAHPQKGSPMCATWYAGEFKAALKEAGIEGRVRTFHDMRHTALTNLAATGASPIAVMATAGHRSMATTNQYVHLAGVTFAEEAAALERRLLGVQETGTNEPETAQLSGSL
jgi:integrase